MIRLLTALPPLAAVIVSGVTLVELHGPDHQIIYLNPHEVTSVRAPRAYHAGRFAPGTRCVVAMVNGNFIAVLDTCEDVRAKLRQAD